MPTSWNRATLIDPAVQTVVKNYPFVQDFSTLNAEVWAAYEENEVVAAAAVRKANDRTIAEALAFKDINSVNDSLRELEALARQHGSHTLVINYAPEFNDAVLRAGYRPMQVKRWMRLDLPLALPNATQPLSSLHTATPAELATLYTSAYQPRFPNLVMQEETFRAFFLEDESEPLVSQASGVLWIDGQLAGAVIVQERPMADLRERYEPGMASAESATGYWVSELIVDPARIGRGLGRDLLQHALRELQALGASEVNLNVDLDNLSAEVLYRKLGFTSVGEPARRTRKVLQP